VELCFVSFLLGAFYRANSLQNCPGKVHPVALALALLCDTSQDSGAECSLLGHA